MASTDPPQLAMDPGGDAFADLGGARRRDANRRSADGIAADPLWRSTVPVSGSSGTALAMSAAATDAWSSPVTIHWDFGDGTGADGAAVSHAYAAGGTETVTISATDAVGNVSAAQTRQIVVSQAPPPEIPQQRVKLSLRLPKQSWRAIAKAKGVKLKCGLDLAGSCQATATLARGVAKRLGLAIGKRASGLRIGAGTARVPRAGVSVDLVVKLSGKARKAIAKATRKVPIKLAISGSAAGRLPATRNKTLTVKRP